MPSTAQPNQRLILLEFNELCPPLVDRFIDEGDLVAYKFGRVIRIQEPDVDRFIEASRISPGSLEHLYPEVKGNGRASVTVGGMAADGVASAGGL